MTKNPMEAQSLRSLLEAELRATGGEERSRLFRDILQGWGAVVGPAARHSAPYELTGKTLHVQVRTSHVKQRIEQMKGNIRRQLKARWGVDVEEVRVTMASVPRRVDWSPRRRAPIEPSEEEVRSFRAQCPATLPPETADALARLRAFFARRFPSRP